MLGLGILSQGIGSALTAGLGIYQYAKGQQEQDANKRPEYQIPKEISDNLSQAQMMALEGLPAEQKQQYIQNIQRSSNFGLRAISSRKGGLAGVAGLVQNQNDASANLLSQDAAARQQNQRFAMQEGNTMANYKDQAFKINKLNPYYEKTAESQALLGAGIQNIAGGIRQGEGAAMLSDPSMGGVGSGAFGEYNKGKRSRGFNGYGDNQMINPDYAATS
jgi:hypothetical protein